MGSGKTALLFHALHALRMPCFLVNSYDLTLQSGSDAHVALHDRFLHCAQFAPCALLIDPLEAIAPENASRRIDRSASDNALLAELKRINELSWQADEKEICIWSRTEGYPAEAEVGQGGVLTKQNIPAHTRFDTESLAKFAFSILYQAARFSLAQRVPVLLDY